MKILILAAPFEFYKGGSELQNTVICNYLEKKGFDVHFLFHYKKDIKSDNFHTYRYLFRKKYNRYLFTDFFQIYRLISKINPDIIYKRGINYITGIGTLYCKINRIPFIAHIASERDVNVFSKRILRNYAQYVKVYFDELINRYVISNSNFIVAQAEYQSNLMKKNYKREANLIIPNMHFYPTEFIKRNNGEIKILWIANFKKLKQPEKFIELAKELKDGNAKFIMIGRTSPNKWSQDLINEIKNINNLSYIGEQSIEEVNKLLAGGHIFVNTSLYEGFPNTFIQAWMRKVPVVSLNIDPDDVLKTNRIGYHSKSFDKMVEDVNTLIENSALREDIGNKAQEYAFKNHSMQNIEKLIQLIENDTK
ncbi:MAG: glycosyltransferase [Candidatus Lokiarchaeota archaeon]|nr:glycosyltransferase [Candidatus Lokiarchaeota archaeon]